MPTPRWLVYLLEILIIDCRLDEEFVRGTLGTGLDMLPIVEMWRRIAEFVVRAQTWMGAPLSPDGDFLLFIGAEPWLSCVHEIASWCEAQGIELTHICDAQQPKLLPCSLADVGIRPQADGKLRPLD